MIRLLYISSFIVRAFGRYNLYIVKLPGGGLRTVAAVAK